MFRSIPLLFLVPAKFRPYLVQRNSTLVIQLQTIQSRDEQLTLVAGIDWKETEFEEPTDEKFLTNEIETEEPENLLVEPQKYSKSIFIENFEKLNI